MGVKKCRRCKIDKSISEFHKDHRTKDGLKCYCKDCHWDRCRIRNLGITKKDYNKSFLIQEGKCAICGVHQKDLKRKLFVDHNHKTGKVRDLLCSKCNFGLGHFNDDPWLLEKAIKYLGKHKE